MHEYSASHYPDLFESLNAHYKPTIKEVIAHSTVGTEMSPRCPQRHPSAF